DGTIIRTPLPVPRTCHYCSARLFHHETFEMCCNGGKVSLPRVNGPQELLEIFLDPSAEGNHFRKHIRGYNHVFSFTSCGVHIDEQLAITGHGIYTFRLTQRSDVHECSLVIRERPANQPQYSLPTASQVAAIIVGDDVETMIRGRDIKVQTHAGSLRRIQEFIRPDDHSTVLQAGRLLQQYVVDNYVKIETGKLRWVRNRQKKLRAELYQGLQDALHTGETNVENVGRKRTILPSSFIGSRRDMTQRYEDGMAIVLKEGKPDIFLTMTCNPSWTEITSELNPVQTPQDRRDLTTRIFRAKFEQLKEDVITKGVLGKVKSYIYVTEFQKRGLPHVHILLILENNDKLIDPEHYDSLVRAEIPSKEVEPHLHDAVLKHMIHGPCGTLDQSSPCMKNGKCKRNYPKEFAAET
ncbi:uncharacterized protein LOC107472399, partial [Arachis duranensis]|uniref:Uncharacterized protein LOC107472399 n=1 Tax=Arachis duranensis TaxID=130453 RepID=A0A9C6TES3_ARADU